MRIFSKGSEKEYNEELENILENKKVDSEAKNLLLSMLYKIENSYNDYYIVKSNVLPKEKFIKKVLSIISEECKEIIVVTPGTKLSKPLERAKKNCLIEVAAGKILAYANEKDLLYALFMLDIQYNQYKIDKEYNLKGASKEEMLQYRAIQNFFCIGTAMHEAEVIRDFSGWSWSPNAKDIEDINLNLVYQNILLLVGTKTRDEILVPKAEKNKFLGLHATVKDLRKYNQIEEDEKDKKNINQYNDIIRKAFSKNYDYDSVKSIIYDINLVILAMEIQKDQDKKKQMATRLREEKKLVKLMENKETFLKTLEKNKIKLASQIEKINMLLNNPKLLEREYEKRNAKLPDEKKIFSANQLAKMLAIEKKQYENEIKIESELFKPKQYNEKQNRYKKEVYFYDAIIRATDNIEMLLIKVQKDFLQCFTQLIEKTSNKSELLNLIYRFRYYCLLPWKNNKQIKDIPELKQEIQEVINFLIDKCIDKKILENISNSVSLCYEILKYIFETQTANINSLEVRVIKNKEEIISINEKKEKNILYHITVDFFDGKEQVESHQSAVDNLKLLNIRLKKKTALFL